MKILARTPNPIQLCMKWPTRLFTQGHISIERMRTHVRERLSISSPENGERGDVPGWVLVVLMTTGLVTAIWMIAAPRLTAILRNSLDSMNGIR